MPGPCYYTKKLLFNLTVYSSVSLPVLSFTYKSLIHLEIIIVYRMVWGLKLRFLHIVFIFSCSACWGKKTIIFALKFFGYFVKNNLTIIVQVYFLILDLRFISSQHLAVLISRALRCAKQSGSCAYTLAFSKVVVLVSLNIQMNVERDC